MYSEQKRERERLRGIWRGMIARCTNSSHQSFNHYGMRGIRVCDDWNNSFDSFYKWSISSGCSNGLSIDRINVSGNYEPSNCRWATCSEQSNNKTNNRIIEYLGVRKTVSEWAHECGLPYMIFYRRIFYDNWPINKALSEPKGARFNKDWVIDKNEPLIDNRRNGEIR